MNLPVRGQIYVASVAALGLIAIGICIATLFETPVSSEWFFLALLTLLTGSFTVAVPDCPPVSPSRRHSSSRPSCSLVLPQAH